MTFWPGSGTTTWNSSSAPAASPRTAPCATMAAAVPSGRRPSSCSAASSAITPTSKTAFSAASMPSRWTPCRGINPKAWSTAFWNGFMRWKKQHLTLNCEIMQKHPDRTILVRMFFGSLSNIGNRPVKARSQKDKRHPTRNRVPHFVMQSFPE